MHHWGDEWFEKNGRDLDSAIWFIMSFWQRYGRIGTHGKEKYGCYDGETKVLTSNGWKYFKDLDLKNDTFATIDQEHNLRYEKATDYIEYEYCGEMIHINTKGADLLVTPNHNLYFARPDKNGGPLNRGHKNFPFKLEPANAHFQEPKKFTKGARWEGSNENYFLLEGHSYVDSIGRSYQKEDRLFPIKPWLALLGWIVAEGFIGEYEIAICLNNTDGGKEASLVSSILKELNLKYKTSIVNRSSIVFRLYDRQLSKWAAINVGKLAKNKRVPDFIKRLSPELISIFLDSLYLGDGWETKTAKTLSTVSPTLAFDCLELLMKSGFCGRAAKRKPRRSFLKNNKQIVGRSEEYHVRWLKKTEHLTINSHDDKKTIKEKEKKISYSGKVYCVTVPNNTLYTMRDSMKPVWCGNSFRDQVYFWNGGLHGLLYPGYVWIKYPFLYFKVDRYIVNPITKYTGIHWLGLKYQAFIYNLGIQLACKKYPNIIDELVSHLDGYELVKPGLFGKVCGKTIHDKYWEQL